MLYDYELTKLGNNKYQVILYFDNKNGRSEGMILTRKELYSLYSQLRTLFKDGQ